MDIEVLNIIIKSNTLDADQKLKLLQDQLNKTAVATTKISPAVQKTTTDFTGLSRVVQDLPYGFMGISNNLTQLLPAAGGAGLAFSALVSAITFAQVGLQYWTRSSKEAKQATDDFGKSLAKAEATGLATGFQLQAFAKIAGDQTRSLKERNEALNEANKIMGEHGEKLTLVNINTKAAREQIELYTQAIIAQAVAEKYSGRLADLIIKQGEASQAYGKTVDELERLKVKVKEGFDPRDELRLVKAYYASITAAGDYKNATKDLHEAHSLFNTSQEKAILLTAQLGHKTKETAKHTETQADILKALNEQLKFLGAEEINLGISKTTEKISAFEDAIKRLMKIGVSDQGELIKGLFDEINILKLPGSLANFAKFIKKKFGDELEKAPYEPIKIDEKIFTLSDLQATASMEKMRNALNKAGRKVFSAQGILTDVSLLNPAEVEANFGALQDNIKRTAGFLQKALAPAFDAVFSAVEQGQGVFQALGTALKQLITQMITAVIEAAALALILNLIFPGSAAAGGAGGFLNVFKGLMGVGIPKNAAGGVYTRPTLALVGEAGPERITPLNSITNGRNNMIQGEVIFNISGQNLRGILRRADQTAANVF